MSKQEQTTLVPWKQLPDHLHSIVSGSANSVLLQTSRMDSVNHKSFLFLDPVDVVSAWQLDEIPELFRQIESALALGFHVAGYLSYECGYHFEHFEGISLEPGILPLAWFGIYRDPSVFEHQPDAQEQNLSRVESPGPASSPGRIAERVELHISEEDYRTRIRQIQQYIEAGDTYQVNFTDRVSLPIAIAPHVAFGALVKQQPVAYSAFLHVAGHHILSLSPELFFRIEEGRITTRPMKGTMPRGLDAAEDDEASTALQRDEKNRAEHLMIVDLLRNDLGRICEMGSVRVDDLFSVERYATLLQMTSTVSGALRTGLSYYEIFKALFPSGSITGAPKIRTMQIIREVEQAPRGIYTGAIGFISPDRMATFNVAIRTLVLKDGHAQMGVGGGIVADSNAEEEYRECRLKTEFLVRQRFDFQLLETMLWDGEYAFVKLHMDRMQSSASYFDFHFERDVVSSALAEAAEHFVANDRRRVRLLLDEAGRVTVTAAEFLQEKPSGRVCLSAERTSSRDVFLRHKTTHRRLYDTEYAEARAHGFDDVLFMNERGEVTEGAISNLFIQREERLLTPPLCCGVLPGVFRRHLLETRPAAEEQVLSLAEILAAEAVFLGNSVRGLRRVTLSL